MIASRKGAQLVSEPNVQRAGIGLPVWGRKIGIAVLAIAAAIVGYIVFQRYLRIAATILLLAAMMTYLLQPAVEWGVRISRSRNTHAARTSATLVIYLIIAAGLYGLGAGIVNTVSASVQDLRQNWVAAQHRIPRQLQQVEAWYEKTIPATVRLQIASSAHQEMGKVSEKYVPTVVGSLFGLARKAGEWIGLLVELIFVPLVAFYFLTDARKVREQVLFFVPRRHRHGVMQYAGAMGSILRQYVQSQLILCAIAWVVVTVAMLVMGIPGALLLGIIAGISRAIPLIGPLVGGIPVLGSVLLTPQWAGAFWWVLIGFTLLHFIESKFIMPRILGDHLGVHPVIVIISLLVGYEMLGLLGMFLAPPVIAMVRFILAQQREFAQTAAEQLLLPLSGDPLSSGNDKIA